MTQRVRDAEESRFMTRIMTLGSGTALPVVMTPSELARLIGVIYRDTKTEDKPEALPQEIWNRLRPEADYYDVEDAWFIEPLDVTADQLLDLVHAARSQIANFTTYLTCISELHKRRKKYARILEAQPIPTMVQVSPRSLVEFGSLPAQELASWLTWRKFFYDLDNRAAQETGYLFEPILAAAIGGEPKSARTRVVTRTGDPSKGRQVDCWKVVPGERPLAYEFKLRVTIAASGQGRFREELQFAEDCVQSGAKPVLVVLDPTENTKLTELQRAFIDKGGEAYIGEDAWEHLEAEAGENLDLFIEKYVHQPIRAVSVFETQADTAVLDFKASYSEAEVVFTLGAIERRIARAIEPSLAPASDDEEE